MSSAPAPAPAPAPAAPRLPRPYLAWLAGVSVSQLGDSVLAFALGWAAAGLGGTTAALVLTLSSLPRVVLLLVGGAVADRFGARRVLVASEACLLGVTAALGLTLGVVGAPAWLLLASALALGTVLAFSQPAAGSMPRRLVSDDLLPRALALRQGVSQAVLMAGAPLGGALVATVGLPVIAWADAGTFAVGLAVLVAVRGAVDAEAGSRDDGGAPVIAPSAPAGPVRRPWHDLLDGVRVTGRTPGLTSALALVGAGAALLLPVTSLLLPLLGRSVGWGAGTTGVVVGAQGAGVIIAALVAARRRRARPAAPGDRSAAPDGSAARRSACVGLAAGAAGTLLLAISPALAGQGPGLPGRTLAAAAAVAGALVLGLGSGTFVARLAPLVLGSAPRTHLARVQALVGLAQLVPVMVTTTVLGTLAQQTSPRWALLAAATALAVCAAGAVRGRAPRPAARGSSRKVAEGASPR